MFSCLLIFYAFLSFVLIYLLSLHDALPISVLAPIPASEVSAFGTSCIVYCSIASTGNCSPGNGTDQEGPSRKLSHARSCVARSRVGSEAGFAPPESRAWLKGVGSKPERPRPA